MDYMGFKVRSKEALEDLVLVTEDGCEVLTDFPYDLEV